MLKRVLLLAAPLCVVAIAANVAVAAPSSDAEHRGEKLDKLHAERPDAAPFFNLLDQLDAPVVKAAGYPLAEYESYQAAQVARYLTALAAQQAELEAQQAAARQAELDAQQAEAEARQAQLAARSSATQSRVVTSSSYPGDFLACVRQRESGGNYGIYNSGGSGAAGAYQFMPGTWNSIAASSGRGDLVGVDPAQAAPADQDSMAQALYAQQGAAPWGGGC
jgi:soluble lytic murein transglycosylase-like protein